MANFRAAVIIAIASFLSVGAQAQNASFGEAFESTEARADIATPGGALIGAANAQGSRAGDEMRGSSGTAKSDRESSAIESNTPHDAKERWARTHRASKIIGTDVRNREGEEIGAIKEIVLDPRTGNVSYAVLALGGVLGLGDKLFAVPWKALQLDSKDNTFVLDVEKERLKEAPGFEPDRWPDMANAQWNTSVHKFYGQRYGVSTKNGRVAANPQRDRTTGGTSDKR